MHNNIFGSMLCFALKEFVWGKEKKASGIWLAADLNVANASWHDNIFVEAVQMSKNSLLRDKVKSVSLLN